MITSDGQGHCKWYKTVEVNCVYLHGMYQVVEVNCVYLHGMYQVVEDDCVYLHGMYQMVEDDCVYLHGMYQIWRLSICMACTKWQKSTVSTCMVCFKEFCWNLCQLRPVLQFLPHDSKPARWTQLITHIYMLNIKKKTPPVKWICYLYA